MTNDRNQAEQNTNAGTGTRDSIFERADHVVTPGENVQAAVDAASAGDVVGVESGTYTEQVVLEEHVTLVGAGRGNTTIRSPPSLARGFTRDGDEFRPVVLVENGGAAVRNLTVDGDRQGHGNEAFVGVGSHDATLSLEDVEVRAVGDDPPNAARHGLGVFAHVGDGETRQVEVTRCEVHGYQRGGVVGDGAGLSIYVEESRVSGRDANAPVRQSGVQVSGVDRATVVGCTVSDNYHAETTLASGVTLVDASDVFLAWNTVERNDIGVAATGTDEVVVRRNNVHSNGVGVLNFDRKPFDATNNWWGDADGPSESSLDVAGESVAPPDGSGDTVCNVEWDPYSEDRFDLKLSNGAGVDGRETPAFGATDRRSHGGIDTR